jgi:hypothetical protein
LVNICADHVYTQLGTTSNCSTTANLHTLQTTTAVGKPLPTWSVFPSLSLATASNSGDPSASRAQVLSSQPPVQTSTLYGQLIGSPQLPSLCTDRRENIVSNINCIVVCVFVATGTCLPIRCIETCCLTPLYIRLLHGNGCTRYNKKEIHPLEKPYVKKVTYAISCVNDC